MLLLGLRGGVCVCVCVRIPLGIKKTRRFSSASLVEREEKENGEVARVGKTASERFMTQSFIFLERQTVSDLQRHEEGPCFLSPSPPSHNRKKKAVGSGDRSPPRSYKTRSTFLLLGAF